MQYAEINDPLFRRLVESVHTGNTNALQQLLETNPELVNRRLDVPTEGYFAHPYPLWFVADNPIAQDKLPSNIVEITKTILKALQKNSDDSYQYQLDYALGLVSTGRIPKECGVQQPLMKLLIEAGAIVKGSVLGAISQHNFEAAIYLLEKGADYNLATAVGLYRIGEVEQMVVKASSSERYVALVVASFFGNAAIICLLLQAGADVNGQGGPADFGGFHSHASPLHQAVSSGSLEAVTLLVEAGANLETRDKIYDGNPLDWSHYLQKEEHDETLKKKYKKIEDYLTRMISGSSV